MKKKSLCVAPEETENKSSRFTCSSQSQADFVCSLKVSLR